MTNNGPRLIDLGRGPSRLYLFVLYSLLLTAQILQPTLAKKLIRRLDVSYRPPPLWGCENGLPAGAIHVVIATLAPEPMSLIPWIWNLGLTGAEIWIYHRLDLNDVALTDAAATIAAFEPYPCASKVRLQQLLPNKGREAAVYLSHIVRHYDNLPEGLVLIHDHGPAARHSLCGPFFRRLRGYYAGIREQVLLRQQDQRASAAPNANASSFTLLTDGAAIIDDVDGGSGGGDGQHRRRVLETSTRHRRRQREGGGGGNGGGGGGSATSVGGVRQVLMDFANQVVSLSSGCQENWLKGCCAQLVCAEDPADDDWMATSAGDTTTTTITTTTTDNDMEDMQKRSRHLLLSKERKATESTSMAWDGTTRRPFQGRCPFKTSRCLANVSAINIPLRSSSTQRWLYLHGAGGLYDTRYENLIVLHDMAPGAAAAAITGTANSGFGPLSLVRYAGPDATDTVRVQTSAARNLDYPEGEVARTPQETFAQLGRILTTHDFPRRRARSGFKSCCASLMLRPKHIHYWPKTLYEQMLSYTLDKRNSYHASLAVSHHAWALWGIEGVGFQDLLRYFEVDLLQLNIRGCPGWRVVWEAERE